MRCRAETRAFHISISAVVVGRTRLGGDGQQLVQDDEFDLQLEGVCEVLDRLFREMLVGVGEDEDDDVDKHEVDVYVDEIPFYSAHIDLVVY